MVVAVLASVIDFCGHRVQNLSAVCRLCVSGGAFLSPLHGGAGAENPAATLGFLPGQCEVRESQG